MIYRFPFHLCQPTFKNLKVFFRQIRHETKTKVMQEVRNKLTGGEEGNWWGRPAKWDCLTWHVYIYDVWGCFPMYVLYVGEFVCMCAECLSYSWFAGADATGCGWNQSCWRALHILNVLVKNDTQMALSVCHWFFVLHTLGQRTPTTPCGSWQCLGLTPWFLGIHIIYSKSWSVVLFRFRERSII